MNDTDITPQSTEITPRAALYLMPVTLSDTDPAGVLPQKNLMLLRRINHFVVENLRTARRFIKKADRSIDLESLHFVELNEHTDERDIPEMLNPVLQGNAVALMSEAGCPAVADPGARLVEYAHRRGVEVIPLVGPSSILLALMASGMNGQNFCFRGYLPIDEKKRAEVIKYMISEIRKHDTTQIFIETPYRNNRLLDCLLKVVPSDINLCIGADITGPDECIKTHSVADWKKLKPELTKLPTIFLLGK